MVIQMFPSNRIDLTVGATALRQLQGSQSPTHSTTAFPCTPLLQSHEALPFFGPAGFSSGSIFTDKSLQIKVLHELLKLTEFSVQMLRILDTRLRLSMSHDHTASFRCKYSSFIETMDQVKNNNLSLHCCSCFPHQSKRVRLWAMKKIRTPFINPREVMCRMI